MLRKRLAIWLDRQSWVAARHAWAMSLLWDWAERDPAAFQRFLWSHHIGYARFYESANKFGGENLLPSRKLLVEELVEYLGAQGVDPVRDVHSILDVGSSAGFLLRYLETRVFTSATELLGLDIDSSAVAEGSSYLSTQNSRIRLLRADLADLASIAAGKKFDILLCTGVLLCVTEAEAESAIGVMLRHARLVVLSVLAHPEMDNRNMTHSVPRAHDRTWIHNIDAMIERRGGEVTHRHWMGDRLSAGQLALFIFCRQRNSPGNFSHG
ncbi:MAG: class I SAM-dependent methyltransferase [Bryobacteraceae bacterium]